MFSAIDMAEEMSKRMPPVIKPFFYLLAAVVFFCIIVVALIGWSLGFYYCANCGKLRHVFTQAKEQAVYLAEEGQEKTQSICKTCWNEEGLEEEESELHIH